MKSSNLKRLSRFRCEVPVSFLQQVTPNGSVGCAGSSNANHSGSSTAGESSQLLPQHNSLGL